MIGQDNMVRVIYAFVDAIDLDKLGFLKGKEKITAEYSLVFLAYNLRRAMSILGVKGLLARVKTVFFDILALGRRKECQSRSFSPENLGVVWRGRVAQVMGGAA